MSLTKRDKQLAEMFLQKFLIANSNVLIEVVGELTISDQKLLHVLESESKMMLVVHNLVNYETNQQVNEYIESILMQSVTLTLEKVYVPCLTSIMGNEQLAIYQQVVKNHHLIMSRDGSEAGNTLNEKAIDFLKMQILVCPITSKFPIVDQMKLLLSLMSKDLFEKPKLEEGDIDITDDRVIKLKNPQDIVFKNLKVDELGVDHLVSKTFTPKFYCKVTKDSFLIELAISDQVSNLNCQVTINEEINTFRITGTRPENEEIKVEEVLYKPEDFLDPFLVQ